MKTENLPKDYQELAEMNLGTIVLSERIIGTRLRIEANNSGYKSILCGVRNFKGKEYEYHGISTSHNWVLDEDVIRPLPRDIVDSLCEFFPSFDLNNLSFSDILAISRVDQDLIEICFAEDIFVPASRQAESISDTQKIPGLKANLFPYQAHGVEWMQRILSQTNGLVLADEMGLGKTIQIIALFLITPPSDSSPALIICPTSLITNWKNEIFRFAPELSVLVHRGQYRAGISRDLQVSQVVITTYDTAVNDISLMSSLEWSWVICDEAQAIKNPLSARRRTLANIPRLRTIPMTGTPVENSLTDLWSLADFAIPGLLGTLEEFTVRYPDSSESAIEVSQLTNPIILRRTVKDVAGDLPDRMDIDFPIVLTEELSREYERIRKDTIEEYGAAGALVATGQLQMFCAHPWLQYHKSNSPFWEEDATLTEGRSAELISPKIERTVDLILESFSNNRKVIVFSVFNRCADLIRQALGDQVDLFWSTINGSTPQEERQEIIDEFSKHSGNACLVLNPRAAGAGLNITSATVVIHFTQVWNPALEAQASARAHRRGQENPVTIYRLYYENTIESVMIERSQWKRELGNDAVPITTREKDDLRRALEISPGAIYE